MKQTIMLLGVHGVGKTYLLSQMKHTSYSASELIRKYQQEEVDSQKKVANVKGNQDTLLKAIEQQNILGKCRPYLSWFCECYSFATDRF